MNIKGDVRIKIQENEPWILFFPHKKVQQKQIQSTIYAGHYNHILPVTIRKPNKVEMNDSFPILLKKMNNRIKIGPIVGILTVDDKKRFFRGNQSNFKDLITTGIKTDTLVYVFTPNSINYFEKSVNAFLYIPKDNKWVRKTMPLPDVVYNRIPYRGDEKKANVQESLQFFKNEKIPFFNPYFFDKWTLYKWLKESRELKWYIPNTNLLSKYNLKSALHVNPILYLKPVHGKAGIGFIRLMKKNSDYSLTYQTKKETYTTVSKTYSEVWEKVQKLVKDKEYIIQTAINLVKYIDRPFDIRVLVQKNEQGKWKTTGVGTRVAGVTSITTHVPRGGFIGSTDKVFNHSFGDSSDRYKNIISDLAEKVANYIESKVRSPLGEISLDIGIDKENKLWIFEANSKPMKFDEPIIRKTSLLRLMQYSRYLSGFVKKEGINE